MKYFMPFQLLLHSNTKFLMKNNNLTNFFKLSFNKIPEDQSCVAEQFQIKTSSNMDLSTIMLTLWYFLCLSSYKYISNLTE